MRSKILCILLLGLFFSAIPQTLYAQGGGGGALFEICLPVGATNFKDDVPITCSGTGSPEDAKYKVEVIQRSPMPAVIRAFEDEELIDENEEWADAWDPPVNGKWPTISTDCPGDKTPYRITLYEWRSCNWCPVESINITVEKT